jgi:hypothetical protein
MNKPLSVIGTLRVLQDIADERARHTNVEGCSRDHDDEHTDGALALAAAAYIGSSLKGLGSYGPPDGQQDDIDVLISMSPWSIRFQSGRNSLIKAAALIVAEVERRDRAAGTV